MTTYPNEQAEALADIASALAHAGQLDQAQSIAQSISNPNEQAEALADIASALAHAGQFEQAQSIAQSISNPNEQAKALASVACELMKTGNDQEAKVIFDNSLLVVSDFDKPLQVVSDIRYKTTKISTLITIAELMTSAGDNRAAKIFDQAYENIRKLGNKHHHTAQQLIRLATAMAQSKYKDSSKTFDEAFEFISRWISNIYDQEELLSELALGMAKSNENRASEIFEQAYALVLRLDYLPDQAKAFRDLAKYHLISRNYLKALDVFGVQKIEDLVSFLTLWQEYLPQNVWQNLLYGSLKIICWKYPSWQTIRDIFDEAISKSEQDGIVTGYV